MMWYNSKHIILVDVKETLHFLHSHVFYYFSIVFYFFGKFYKILTVLILMLLDQCALENECSLSGLSSEDNSPRSL